MAVTIKPFSALRPRSDKVSQVAALPYDVMNTKEAREEVKDNPYSFLHVDKAEIHFADDANHYAPEVYAKAKENLEKLKSDGVLIKDNEQMLYVYQVEGYGKKQTGLATCVSVKEYEQGIIKRHEFTRPVKEKDRIDHILACEAHTGPIFMAYRDNGEETAPQKIMANWINNNSPIYDFKSEDGVRHAIWTINDINVISKLTNAFKNIPYIYIADGHHRNEAAYKAAKDDNLESQFYLAVIFPHTELAILDYNRIVKELNGLTKEEFLKEIQKIATVKESTTQVKPGQKYEIGMYMANKWYKLTFNEVSNDVIQKLDVSVLQNKVLTPILNISDPRSDARIDFVGGIRGLGELERLVDSGKIAVAFSMFPTTMDELMAVADSGNVMPPKSTWFEPKLRSGLLIHEF